MKLKGIWNVRAPDSCIGIMMLDVDGSRIWNSKSPPTRTGTKSPAFSLVDDDHPSILRGLTHPLRS
jgi:hypothetical protein